jgi:arginase
LRWLFLFARSATGLAGRLPVIVAGNCNVGLGAIGGIDAPRLGIVWLDAHPDFHTPETTDSGFIDGMGLAAATGACWKTLCNSIPGFHAAEERTRIREQAD